MATALLERQDVQRLEAAQSEAGVVPYYWTVNAYYHAYEAGVFEDPQRLELIHGRIIRKMPQNAPHASLRRRLSRRLRGSMEPPFLVMEESPLRLALDGEPVPDLFIVTGVEGDYERRHPTQEDAVLVVEVSNTTVAFDLGEKALLYAQAGIADYWVVLVNESAIVRHRTPTPEGYQDVTRLAGDDTLSPLAAPEAAWTVNALLGREDAPEED